MKLIYMFAIFVVNFSRQKPQQPDINIQFSFKDFVSKKEKDSFLGQFVLKKSKKERRKKEKNLVTCDM